MIEDFYTTPESLIGKMTSGLKLREITTALDVGAGKGDISDYLKKYMKDYYRGDEPQIDCIEINPDLQHILKGKNHRLIHDDFLTFNSFKHYDLIIGNFPFSLGAEFLQKSLAMIEENGGILRCLVNAETLRNPYTKTRQWCLNKIRDLCGEIEYFDGEFLHAERKTGVSVALVKLNVLREFNNSLILDQLQKAAIVDAETGEPAALLEQDYYRQMISSFDMECKAGQYLISEYFAMKPYILDRFVKENQSDYSKPIISMTVEGISEYKSSVSEQLNGFLRKVRRKYWNIFIHHPSFSGKYTSNVLNDLSNKLNELEDYDFTLFNINELEKDLNSRINKGVHDAILKLFETFCNYSYWRNENGEADSQNVHYYNGWKTNKAHRINEKIILPINGISSWNYGKKHFELERYKIEGTFADMVKVFELLAAEDHKDAYRLVGNQIHYANERKDYTLDLRFFDVKFYKKGTCHIKFKNKALLDKLNIYGAQRKQWLPPCYGQKAYRDMNTEEKAVVDDFQGKEAYSKVCDNPAFYLVPEQSQTLQLTA